MEDSLGAITVRNLDDDVQRRLRQLAATHNRSMEAEVRAILGAAVLERSFPEAWLDMTAEFRGDELPLPQRSLPREISLS
jgi:antitoxin FitA